MCLKTIQKCIVHGIRIDDGTWQWKSLSIAKLVGSMGSIQKWENKLNLFNVKHKKFYEISSQC